MSPVRDDVGVCGYGFNFRRIDKDFLIAGFVLDNYAYQSPAWKSNRRQLPVVQSADVEAAIRSYRVMQHDEFFTVDYLRGHKPEILKGLSFFHDYRQINTQIIQNISAHLESRYPHLGVDEKLKLASHHERAVYEAARFLEEKLNVARFLVDPEWLEEVGACTRFRVHGLVTKYVKIYRSRCDERRVQLRLTGTSYSEVEANGTACGVIPHTLLDNAVKYSPDNSRIDVTVQDVANGVYFEVASFGPAISRDEEIRIFDPFVRGKAAIEAKEEGAGYGLYVSQLVAKHHLGTVISVKQDKSLKRGGTFWTTFAVTFPQKAAILVPAGR